MHNFISDDDEQLWQHVFDELDSTIDIADQMANATDPMRHSPDDSIMRTWELQGTRYNEFHLFPLTVENLALHNILHGRTRWIVPSDYYYSSFEDEHHYEHSTPHISEGSWISVYSSSMEATRNDDWWNQ